MNSPNGVVMSGIGGMASCPAGYSRSEELLSDALETVSLGASILAAVSSVEGSSADNNGSVSSSCEKLESLSSLPSSLSSSTIGDRL